MQPTIYNLSYYEGDTFSIIVYPKDSTGHNIDLTGGVAYFRLADKRGSLDGWHDTGSAEITTINENTPTCIKCTLTSVIGQSIQNGYVYDIGYSLNGSRVTLVTGSFQVMSEVKKSGDTI